jgi:hypothetical protein
LADLRQVNSGSAHIPTRVFVTSHLKSKPKRIIRDDLIDSMTPLVIRIIELTSFVSFSWLSAGELGSLTGLGGGAVIVPLSP